MTLQPVKFGPGYQGTRTNSVEVAIYSHADDPILSGKKAETYAFLGRSSRDEAASVFSVATDKALGVAAGTFSVEVKDPGNLMEVLSDDDWIDITMNVNGARFHVLRGLVDTFRETTQSGSSGATVRTVTITGRDFGAIFEKTKVWFNQFRAENAGYDQTVKMFQSLNVIGTPAQAVERILFGFLETMSTADPPRANWRLPPTMPGRRDDFPSAITFIPDDFNNDPSRYAISQALMDPAGQGIWALAQEWSDPQFCEMFCDLVIPEGDLIGDVRIGPGQETDPTSTAMGVIFRDRPFPTVRDGMGSPWFKLPLAFVSRQDTSSISLGRGGMERYNAFFVSPTAISQLNANGLDLTGPLWDPDSIQRHGFRDFSVDSRYIAQENDLFTMSSISRQIARDFHCLNPYFLNGSLSLVHLRPDIRVGTRVTIPGASADEDLSFYVEQVTHSWRLGQGRTTLGVTRGWRGTAASLLDALQTMADRYVLLPGDDANPVATPSLPARLPGTSDGIPE
jgi:hypothetical protein